jgi:O-antigen/teichoic acid export membrane protein
MSLRRQSIRGSFVLTLGEGVGYGASFVRNMILARMLTKADFGIAAAFSMIITLLEFSAKLGISRFVIRDQEGDDPVFLAAAHLVQAVAALLSSLLMVAAAWPLARLFGIGDHVGALYVLALIPLLNGFSHLDVRRFERQLRFGPSTGTEAIPQVAIMLAAWPVASWLGDYRAVLVLLIVKAACSCGTSHWLAGQPYRWRMHREYVARMLRFGWPLLVNGFLMFGVMQGDQFLIASFYTMADLAPYAAAVALTTAPTFIFYRIFNSIMLPLMAKVQDDPQAFHRRYRQALAVISTFSVVTNTGVIIGAEAIMRFVYGSKYTGSGIILGCLALVNAFRNVRTACSLAALARGDSQNQMISNLWRATSLLPALGLALTHQPVWLLACAGLIGEALACRAAFTRLQRRDGVPLRTSLLPAGGVTLAAALALGIWLLGVRSWNPYLTLLIAGAGSLMSGGLMILATPLLRQEARAGWKNWQARGWRAFSLKTRNAAPAAPTR